MGENAAAGTGQAGMQTASTMGNYLTSGAAAGAAGQIGAANAWAGAANNIGNTAGQFGMFAALQNSGMFGGQSSMAGTGGGG